MRERARSSFRFIGLLALAAAAIGLACDDGPLSDEEMGLLRGFVLAGGPPQDPTNAYGDRLEAARLGKLLYFETRYSGPLLGSNVAGVNGALGNATEEGKVSCNVCHDLGNDGVDRRSLPGATSLGAGYTTRNAPTVINAAYSPLWQFWDGHADSLWSQALLPPEGATECNGSRLAVAKLLFDRYQADYDAIFPEPLPAELGTGGYEPKGKPGERAFDDLNADQKNAINRVYANFGKAIAAYERRLVSVAFSPSPFDLYMAGDTQALSPAAIRGARLFVGRAGCLECHGGPMFSDFAFHNVGTPQAGENVPARDLGRSEGIDVLVDSMKGAENPHDFTRQSALSDRADSTHLASLVAGDPSVITNRPTDGQFKTPTLRNVAKTAPYMHDGAYRTLWDVVNHYNFGGAAGAYAGVKDPAVAPLLLTDAELADLVEFLRALDDGAPKPTDDFPEGLLAPPALPP
jgi:cytochrome c peroxidase